MDQSREDEACRVLIKKPTARNVDCHDITTIRSLDNYIEFWFNLGLIG